MPRSGGIEATRDLGLKACGLAFGLVHLGGRPADAQIQAALEFAWGFGL